MTIRLADRIPPFCAVCFNQAQVRHIDCDAASDRGWDDGAGTPISMDEIIICEGCAKEIGYLVDMTDDEELKAKLRQKESELDKWKRDALKAEEYADRLEDIFDHRPGKIKVDHRRKPREREPV